MLSLLGKIWSLIKRRIQKKGLVVGTAKNTNYDQSLTAQEIKEKYLENQNKFELLRSEVIGCARQIKIWLAISHAKEKFKILKYESVFGWIQVHSILRSITIDGLKITQDTNNYLKSVLGEILTSEQYKNLIKNSRLSARVNALNKIIGPLKTWRNKRYAHLNNEEVAIVACNLQELFFSLASLDSSLYYIFPFVIESQTYIKR